MSWKYSSHSVRKVEFASIDNGPVDVYRITFPTEGKMDVTGVKFFNEAEINRVKIIGEILEVKQIINPH